MTIQKATKQDANALFQLEQKVFDSFNSPLSKRSFYYHIGKNLLLIAKKEKNVAGYILILTSFKCPRIYSIAVDPNFERQGIGKKLLEKALKRNNCLRLEVRKDNEKAIRLYEKIGFEIIGEKLNYYDDGCDAWEMRRVYM